MEEKEILLKTIEGLNASIASLSTTNKNQSEQIKNLQERIKELTAQVAWLNRQLFGRKSEKLRVYDPNMPDLFADEFSGLRQQAEEKRDEAVEKIEKESVEGKHSVNHVFSSPTSIINFTSKKPSYDDTRRSGRDNELLQRAQNDL